MAFAVVQIQTVLVVLNINTKLTAATHGVEVVVAVVVGIKQQQPHVFGYFCFGGIGFKKRFYEATRGALHKYHRRTVRTAAHYKVVEVVAVYVADGQGGAVLGVFVRQKRGIFKIGKVVF